MSQFEKFKEKFEEIYSSNKWSQSSVYNFIERFSNHPIDNPMNAEIKFDETVDESDSYDYRDDRYTKIFFFPEFDIHVKFTGSYMSYHGEEWNKEYTEVKPTIKEITVYE